MTTIFRFKNLGQLAALAVLFVGGILANAQPTNGESATTPTTVAPVAPVPPSPAVPSSHRSLPHEGPPDVVAIVAIGGALALVGVGGYLRTQRSRMMHETIRLMVEKGTPIPPELLASANEPRRGARKQSDLRRGFVCAAIAAGVLVSPGFNSAVKGFGWIFLFLAIAYIINWRIEKNTTDNDNNRRPQ